MAGVPEAGKFVLDPAASAVAIQHKTMWGLVTVRGTFTTVDGVGELHEDGSAGGFVTLGADSLSTKNAKRDTHLRSVDFFDAANHPSIRLEVVDVERRTDSVLDVSGHLRIRGITKPLSLTAAIGAVEADAVTLTTEFDVDREHFQMTWNQLGMMRGLTKVTATLRFTRREG
ncbi:MAG TPA: YceI family protein [Actinospica sp.]|nr:YceI family protein [Actinospica sp.]